MIEDNKLLNIIFTSIKNIYTQLGHGLSESSYKNALQHEIIKQKLTVEQEVKIPIVYDDEIIGYERCDLLINDEIIVELKVQKTECKDDECRQLQRYLIHANKKLGVLINFNKSELKTRLNAIIIYQESDIYKCILKPLLVEPLKKHRLYFEDKKVKKVKVEANLQH